MVDQRGRESIILGDGERTCLLLRLRCAVATGNHVEAAQLEHQLALSRFYEKLRDRAQQPGRRREEMTESFGTISLRRAA